MQFDLKTALEQANAERDILQKEITNAKAEKDQLLKDLDEANSRAEKGKRSLTSTMQSLVKDEPELEQEPAQHIAKLTQAVVENEKPQVALNESGAEKHAAQKVAEKEEPGISTAALQKDEETVKADEETPEAAYGRSVRPASEISDLKSSMTTPNGRNHGFAHGTSMLGRGRGKARHRGSGRKGVGPERCGKCAMISHLTEDCPIK